MTHGLTFGVLGPLLVRLAGRVVTPRSATQRNLLSALLLVDGQPLSAERLLDIVWAEQPPRSGRSWIHVGISRLRGWLDGVAAGEVCLENTPTGYRLLTSADASDLGRLRAALHRATDRPAPERVTLLATALADRRGPVLHGHGLAGVASLAGAAERLCLDAARRLADAALAADLADHAVEAVAALAGDHPLDERLQGSLALLQAAAGRQAEALRTIDRCRGLLGDELGIDPGPDLRSAHLAVLRQRSTPQRPAPAPTWRGPRQQLTTLIGRAEEVSGLSAAVRGRRLVTVVGPGGCGKTTLVSHVAQQLAAEFPGGVVFLGLAAWSGAEDIVSGMGALLGATGATTADVMRQICTILAGEPVLVVVDNAEHVVDACADLVAELLTVENVAVLGTSRQPLGLPSEALWPLEPLAVPRAGAPVDLLSPAVALFVTRARETLPTISFDADDLAAVGRVCRRVDGLPLAVELAAARVRALPVRALADRLESTLDLLDGGCRHGESRHRTLQSTIEWSYRLLDPDDQRLLARLSVFTGGFTVEAVEAVCCAAPVDRTRALTALVGLVDRSLVQPYDVGGERRFRLFEAVREYAGARLTELGERAAVQDGHLAHRLVQARQTEALEGYWQRSRAYRAMAVDAPNIESVLDAALAGDRAPEAAEMVARMFEFWLVNRSFMGVGAERLRRCAALAAQCPAEVRSLIGFWTARIAGMAEDYLGSRELMTRALPDLERHRPRRYREGLISLVTTARFLLDPAALTRIPDMFAALDADEGDEPSTALTAAGGVLVTWGRYADAARLCDDYAARAARRGTPFSVSQQVLRAEVALGLGRPDEALAWCAGMPDPPAAVEWEQSCRAVAQTHLATGDPAAAARFLDGALDQARTAFPASLIRAGHLQVLLAEARRAGGDHDGAHTALLDAMSSLVSRSHFRAGLTGVLAAALLATDLDHPAATALAGGWDGLRRRLGLPVPIGFLSAAARLGVDPAAPAAPDPTHRWAPEAFRDLTARAHRWCAAARWASPRHQPT